MNHSRTHRILIVIALLVAAMAALLLAGCSGGGSSNVSMSDMAAMTADTLGDLVLGPPADPTAIAPLDPPLLKKGKKESVLVAADTAAFANISRGSITEGALKDALKETVNQLNKRLKREGGFTATVSPDYPPTMPTDEHTLVATLVPVTEDGGSPRDKAEGKLRKLVLVRLSVIDPETNTVLRARDYYSGKDVKRPGMNLRLKAR